ncbi:MAG: signal peptidase II [Chitinophagales bacterium]
MRFVLVFIGILGLDQLTKYLVRAYMEVNQSIPLIQNILHLSYVRNQGAAFGLFPGLQEILMFSAIVVIIGVLIYIRKQQPPALTVFSLVLIAAGAAGNLIDRLVFNSVIDFMDFRFWPVFNVADSSLVVGTILLAWLILFPRKEEHNGQSNS